MDQAELTRWSQAAELLDRVLDLPAEQQRTAAEELGEAYGVRGELVSLLGGTRGTSVLDGSLDEVLRDMPDPAPERNALRGQVLGHWKLGEEIGRGGMSVVYHASRTGQDFQQHAALKILSVTHPGNSFVAGFVRERQILSDLRHAGIARLIDGGITPDGTPYLVMEHVEGRRIDRWCEERSAGAATIARLMLKLCDAVAYAHRHLVVHQDIKPANVLVDEHDRPVLIDFGIARLLRQSSGEEPLQAFTPHFAAPEQRSGGAITTATDVFALGMLFRHLVQGLTVDRDLQEILRVATEADPERRYANARNLAEDLQAWLEKRPVRARPPALAYRAGRFVSRNRWGVAAAALVLASLIGGLGAALWQARIAAAERDLARVESARALQVTGFLKDLFRASDPDRARGETVTARELLDVGAHQARNTMGATPHLKAEMLVLLGDLYRELGEPDAAEPLLAEGLALADEVGDVALQVEARRAAAQHRMGAGMHEEALALAMEGEVLLAQAGLVPGALHAPLMQPILFSLAELGRVPEAVAKGRATLDTVRDQPRLSPGARYDYLYSIANVLLIGEHAAEAGQLLTEAAAIAAGISVDPSVQMALHSNLAGVLDRSGDLEESLEHRRLAMDLAEEIYPPNHPERARKLNNLGGTLNNLGRAKEAEQALREALAIYETLYEGTVHPRVAAAHNNLGRVLEEAGRYDAAERHIRRARELAGQLFGTEDPRYAIATGNLGNLHRLLGNLAQADELLTENVEMRREILGPEHRAVGNALVILANLRLDQGRPAEALELTDQALDLYDKAGYTNPRAIVATRARRARALAALGYTERAEAVFAEALRVAEAGGADTGTAWPELLAAHAEFLVSRADPGAREAITRALDVHTAMLGPEHPETMRVRNLMREEPHLGSE